MSNKKSFFERLIGNGTIEGENELEVPGINADRDLIEETEEEGQLTVDVFQQGNDIIVKAVTAGVKPEDLDVEITQEMITIRGDRKSQSKVNTEDFFFQELYWGSFSRTILLPYEVDADEAEATTQNGVITIKLPRLDKQRKRKVKIKNS